MAGTDKHKENFSLSVLRSDSGELGIEKNSLVNKLQNVGRHRQTIEGKLSKLTQKKQAIERMKEPRMKKVESLRQSVKEKQEQVNQCNNQLEQQRKKIESLNKLLEEKKRNRDKEAEEFHKKIGELTKKLVKAPEEYRDLNNKCSSVKKSMEVVILANYRKQCRLDDFRKRLDVVKEATESAELDEDRMAIMKGQMRHQSNIYRRRFGLRKRGQTPM